MLWDRTTGLYPVVDSEVCRAGGVDPRAVVDACFSGGVRVLQLRNKAGPSAAFLMLAEAVVAAARAWNAKVIVNDRADIARMARADGVHVGQEDLPPDLVRIVFPEAVIGVSTHDERQVDEALRSAADYVAVGPVYETGTKQTGYGARGLRLIQYAAGRGKPIVAIGGITLDRAPEVVGAGAAAVAVISDLLSTGNVEARVREYLAAI